MLNKIRAYFGECSTEGEDEDDEETVTIIVESTKSDEQMIQKKTLEFTWVDGTTDTVRTADKWEKEDGDYVLYTATGLQYTGFGRWDVNFKTNIRVFEGQVKAVDVTGRRERTIEGEYTHSSQATIPKEDYDEETHTLKEDSDD